jgi:hypothetical protein
MPLECPDLILDRAISIDEDKEFQKLFDHIK